jgi:hypothetical protein
VYSGRLYARAPAPRRQRTLLGISGDRTGLLGECRWQKAPLATRDVLELQRKLIFVPAPADDVRLLFWTRTGASEPGFPARVYSVADVID